MHILNTVIIQININLESLRAIQNIVCKGINILFKKLKNEISGYVCNTPRTTTEELGHWARECHGDVSVHPLDSTYKKFLTFTNSNTRTGITVVYIVKDHHCCPVTDYNLKIAATKDQRSFSDLLKHMSDITWT